MFGFLAHINKIFYMAWRSELALELWIVVWCCCHYTPLFYSCYSLFYFVIIDRTGMEMMDHMAVTTES